MRRLILLAVLLVACGDADPGTVLDASDSGATASDTAIDSTDPKDGSPDSLDTASEGPDGALPDAVDGADDTEAVGGDTTGDVGLDADSDSGDGEPEDGDVDAAIAPVVVNSWEPGTAWQVTITPGSVLAMEDALLPSLVDAEIEELLEGGVQVLLRGDATLEPWVYFWGAGGAVAATGSVTPGEPLDLTFTAWSDHPCTGTNLDEIHLLLDGIDTDGDGSADVLAGTWGGKISTIDGDCICDTTEFTATAAGVPDTTPPKVSASVSGTWPALGFTMSCSEPVAGTALAAAIDHLVDDEGAPFSLTPLGLEGPPGAATQWRIVPEPAYPPGVQLLVAVAPVADLAGNVSQPVPDHVTSIPALPPAKLGASWDFSGGSLFPSSPFVEVTPTFGTVTAPTGGAMAVLTVAPDAPTDHVTTADIPKYKTLLRVTLAVATTGDWSLESTKAFASVLMAGASSTATTGALVSAAEVAVDGDVWQVSPFVSVDVNISDLANMKGLLRIGLPVPTEPSCLPFTPTEGGVRILIDRIQVI